MADTEINVKKALEKHFEHTHPVAWPIPNRRPIIWPFGMKASEDRKAHTALKAIGLPKIITQEMRDRFWTQADAGQGVNEDADGYMMRCWLALVEGIDR